MTRSELKRQPAPDNKTPVTFRDGRFAMVPQPDPRTMDQVSEALGIAA